LVAVRYCYFAFQFLQKKGNLDHKRFSRYFCRAMYTIAISGFIMASLDLLMPLTAHAAGAMLSAERCS